MDLFTLSVEGFEGELLATVSFDGVEIDSFPVRDLKDAERKARSAAQSWAAENRPTGYTSVRKTFTV